MMNNSLHRSHEGRLLSGVCSGLAQYSVIDVVWIRLAFVLLGLASGLGTALYVILALLIPLEKDVGRPPNEIFQANLRDLGDTVEEKFNHIYNATGQNRFVAAGLIILGGVLLFSQIGWLDYGWVIAVGFILLGGYMLYRRAQ